MRDGYRATLVKPYEHPTVKQFPERSPGDAMADRSAPLDADWLHSLCLDAGTPADVVKHTAKTALSILD